MTTALAAAPRPRHFAITVGEERSGLMDAGVDPELARWVEETTTNARRVGIPVAVTLTEQGGHHAITLNTSPVRTA